jgi:hypothetical protein
MGCYPNIAQSICDADYLLAVKGSQPTPHEDVRSYFDTAPPSKVEKFETICKDQGHGAGDMALNLVRQVADKRFIKRRRKCAAMDRRYLMEILGRWRVNLDSLSCRNPERATNKLTNLFHPSKHFCEAVTKWVAEQ